MPYDPLIPQQEPGGSSDEGLTPHEPAPDIAGDQIALPESYNQNRLVLLPVNPRTQHLYWHIERDEIRRHFKDGSVHLQLELLLPEPGERVIEAVEISHLSGSTYTYHDLNFQKLQARLIGTQEGKRCVLLESAIITTPSGTTHSSPWEIWITKGQEGLTRTQKEQQGPPPESLGAPSSLDQSLDRQQQQMRAARLGLSNPSSDHGSPDHFSSEALHKKREK